MGQVSDPGQVRTREDLVEYLGDLANRVRKGELAIENSSAADLIAGASGWISDMDGYFRNQGTESPDEPGWSLIAIIFAAGLVYE
jgi:hypothetical protein